MNVLRDMEWRETYVSLGDAIKDLGLTEGQALATREQLCRGGTAWIDGPPAYECLLLETGSPDLQNAVYVTKFSRCGADVRLALQRLSEARAVL